MAHLLRRAAFGVAPGEIENRLNVGFDATVHQLVEAGSIPDGLNEVDSLIGGILDFNSVDDVRTWWIYRMAHSARPLQEKLAVFWHGHFATGMNKVNNAYQMYVQNQLFRDHGLGNFSDLLLRVSQDPAMLVYLDGSSNKKAHPNENFAREVMELFTTGVGHYSEKDVQEAARAFTGWQLKNNAFFFNPQEHDFGPKTFLGESGNLDGADILRILSRHPATAERLTRKLFSFFVYEDPEPHVLQPFVQVWKDSQGSLREVLLAIFLSPVFSSARAYRAKIKSPAEFVIGTIRAFGGTVTPRNVVSLMAHMGQDLFNPPSVKGWDGGTAWISTSALFERFNFAAALTTQRGPEGTSHIEPEAVFGGISPTSAEKMVELAVAHLLDGQLPAASRDALLKYLATADPPQPGKEPPKAAPPPAFALDPHTLDEKARGMLHLLLSTPEYQLG
jgi:uncharacterized protein (DUF1800 family)